MLQGWYNFDQEWQWLQVLQNGKVFAEWWPKKGTTMADGKRGKICKTNEEFLNWLKEV